MCKVIAFFRRKLQGYYKYMIFRVRPPSPPSNLHNTITHYVNALSKHSFGVSFLLRYDYYFELRGWHMVGGRD